MLIVFHQAALTQAKYNSVLTSVLCLCHNTDVTNISASSNSVKRLRFSTVTCYKQR